MIIFWLNKMFMFMYVVIIVDNIMSCVIKH